ncbi:MAG TPA: carboxypeptidase-like regulatory domain-containing protein, partial [Pyrinomonadaceae bacterium]
MNNQLRRLIFQFRRLIFAALLISILPAALASFASSSFVARAQDLDNVTISGRILDQNGALVPGGSVTAVLTTTGVERTVTADAQGRYRIIELEPGSYRLRVEAAGFATEEKTDLATVAGQ